MGLAAYNRRREAEARKRLAEKQQKETLNDTKIENNVSNKTETVDEKTTDTKVSEKNIKSENTKTVNRTAKM